MALKYAKLFSSNYVNEPLGSEWNMHIYNDTCASFIIGFLFFNL